MKIIKRDGRIVDYDRSKIEIAIEKANNEVVEKEKAKKEDIKEIIHYIEELNKKRMLVEDIQDIIEEKLMELGKYVLAKKYIVYRYTRALVRKSNTTDETILGLIRNENSGQIENNKNTVYASAQRDYIAGEVSRDLTKRLLLPEKISKADEEGMLYFHNADYFIQPIINTSFVNIGDMLDNGTAINGNMIETPKSFQVACTVLTQIIAVIASNQYGRQIINLKHIGKYLRKSKEKFLNEINDEVGEFTSQEVVEKLVQTRLKKELISGIQTIEYQINTLMTAVGRPPLVTLLLEIDLEDEYAKENAMIIEEILKQRSQGIKDVEGKYEVPKSPRLVYILDECNCLNGGEYDYLTKLALQCAKKCGSPSFASIKKLKSTKKNCVLEGKFNQGVVSINLPQIGIIADGIEEKFWTELDERLNLCKEALMCRHYALVGTDTNVSPIHWKYGAISRLDTEKIDKLLYGDYSNISLGFVGLYEATKLMTGEELTSPKGHDFWVKLIKYLKDRVLKWKKETDIDFKLFAVPNEGACYRFLRIDKEKYGIIKDITDKDCYTSSYYIDPKEKIDIIDKLKLEGEFNNLIDEGAISYVDISDTRK